MQNHMVTRFKGGTAERVVDVKDIKVPSLWHTIEWLRQWPLILQSQEVNDILEAWHLCHDLKRHIEEAANAQS